MIAIDIIITLVYIAIAAALIAVVWSKTRSWRKAAPAVAVLAAVVTVGIKAVEALAGSDDLSSTGRAVADVSLTLVALALTAATACVVWSMWKGRKGQRS